MISGTHLPDARAGAAGPLLLIEEITHRVANEYAVAIASIGVEAAAIADLEARAALHRVARKLGAFAEAHRALQSPATTDDLNVGDYLHRLCAAKSDASLRDRGVKLVLVEDDIVLAPGTCWRVGMIVAELITNAVRHGFSGGAGMIVVEVRQVGAEVVCQVADNGGAPPDPVPSRGRQVVEGLAQELGGEVSWRFAANGVTATLRFPVGLAAGAAPGA